jgi:hypothetical protein
MSRMVLLLTSQLRPLIPFPRNTCASCSKTSPAHWGITAGCTSIYQIWYQLQAVLPESPYYFCVQEAYVLCFLDVSAFFLAEPIAGFSSQSKIGTSRIEPSTASSSGCGTGLVLTMTISMLSPLTGSIGGNSAQFSFCTGLSLQTSVYFSFKEYNIIKFYSANLHRGNF